MPLPNHHHIYPLDTDMMFVVQMGRADQNVSLTPFVKAGSKDTLLTEEGRNALLQKRREILKQSDSWDGGA